MLGIGYLHARIDYVQICPFAELLRVVHGGVLLGDCLISVVLSLEFYCLFAVACPSAERLNEAHICMGPGACEEEGTYVNYYRPKIV